MEGELRGEMIGCFVVVRMELKLAKNQSPTVSLTLTWHRAAAALSYIIIADADVQSASSRAWTAVIYVRYSFLNVISLASFWAHEYVASYTLYAVRLRSSLRSLSYLLGYFRQCNQLYR